MTKTIEVREPNASFDLVVRDGLSETFAEGASSVALGFPLSKIVLHTVTPPINQPTAHTEQREAIARLVIPTAALLELAVHILKNAAQVRDQLSVGSATISSQLDNFLQQLPDLEFSLANRSVEPPSKDGK